MSGLLGLLGIVVEGLDGLVGLDCSPLVVGQDCSNTPVCCEENGDVSLSSIDCNLSALTNMLLLGQPDLDWVHCHLAEQPLECRSGDGGLLMAFGRACILVVDRVLPVST